MMDWGEVLLKGLELLAPVLMAALSWLSVKLAGLIKAKVENEYLSGVLVRLDDAALVVVKELQQAVVSEIKAKSADGKLSDEDKKAVGDAALASLKSNLSAKGLAKIGKILGLEGGALDSFLTSKVEAAVHDVKTTEALVVEKK